MQEQRVKFETAKLAKDKGLCHYFEHISGTEYVPAFYSEDGVYFEETEFQQEDCTIEDRYFMPTQSLLQKWLREVHKVRVIVTQKSGGTMGFEIYTINPDKSTVIGVPWIRNSFFWKNFTSYEDALEEALLEGFKLINKI